MQPARHVLRSPLAIAVLLMMLVGSWGAAPEPVAPAGERTLAQIARERIQAADEGYRLANELHRTGRAGADVVFAWARRQAHAHMDAPESKAERVAFLEGYVRQAQEHEKVLQKQHEAGLCTSLDVLAGRDCRLEAEMWLAKAREQ